MHQQQGPHGVMESLGWNLLYLLGTSRVVIPGHNWSKNPHITNFYGLYSLNHFSKSVVL